MLKDEAGNDSKKKRLKKDEIKEQSLNSITDIEKVDTEELNEPADKVENFEDIVIIVKEYEDIIRTKKKTLCIAYHQGKVFRRFTEKEKFLKLVKEFKVHYAMMMMTFKINIVKLIKEHSKLIKSSATSSFLKIYFVDIQEMCEENFYELK